MAANIQGSPSSSTEAQRFTKAETEVEGYKGGVGPEEDHAEGDGSTFVDSG